MEYRIIDFLYCADGEKAMNELARDGFRFVFMTDTPGRAYVVMGRQLGPSSRVDAGTPG